MPKLAILLLPVLAAAALAGLRWSASNTVGGVTLTGDYEEIPVGGLIEQSIDCEISGVRAGARVTFDMDGIGLGSAIADSGGRARLTQAYHQVPPDAQGRPNGPRVNDNSLLTARVGANSITAVFHPVP
jgi:hypothetical protein